jgi:hypothetical protein
MTARFTRGLLGRNGSAAPVHFAFNWSFENRLRPHFVEYPVLEAQLSYAALPVECPVRNTAVFQAA